MPQDAEHAAIRTVTWWLLPLMFLVYMLSL
jgi:hypothetical protein